jgi:type IV pilus assembly protein PilE
MTVKNKINGFTLIELLVSVAIVGILAGIAYPSYQNSIQKSHRSKAQAALLSLVNVMERTYTETNNYTFATTPNPTEFYNIVINSTQTTYNLQAIPIPGKSQENDTCGTLSIDNFGAKLPAGCWN